MTDYIGDALKEMDPCGVIIVKSGTERVQRQCKYTPNCTELGKMEGKFLCISKMAHHVAEFLVNGSSVDTEKRDMSDFLKENLDCSVIDPEDKTWGTSQLTERNLKKTLNLIVARGEKYYQSASSSGSSRNPLNFHCSNENVVRDLY